MRNNSGIEYAVPIIIMVLLAATAGAAQVGGIFNTKNAQVEETLIKQSAADERRMIKEQHLDKVFSCKVVTENQEDYDRNHDGVLQGRELHDYIRYYKR